MFLEPEDITMIIDRAFANPRSQTPGTIKLCQRCIHQVGEQQCTQFSDAYLRVTGTERFGTQLCSHYDPGSQEDEFDED